MCPNDIMVRFMCLETITDNNKKKSRNQFTTYKDNESSKSLRSNETDGSLIFSRMNGLI